MLFRVPDCIGLRIFAFMDGLGGPTTHNCGDNVGGVVRRSAEYALCNGGSLLHVCWSGTGLPRFPKVLNSSLSIGCCLANAAMAQIRLIRFDSLVQLTLIHGIFLGIRIRTVSAVFVRLTNSNRRGFDRNAFTFETWRQSRDLAYISIGIDCSHPGCGLDRNGILGIRNSVCRNVVHFGNHRVRDFCSRDDLRSQFSDSHGNVL